MAVHPAKPPPFDARAANEAWVDGLKREDGKPYAVFQGGGFHSLNRWVLGIGEFDGKGLADAVKTNATQQNQQAAANTKAHTAMDKQLSDHESRIAALEAAHVPLGG